MGSRRVNLFLLLLVFAAALGAFQCLARPDDNTNWKRADAPLETRWTRTVTPKNVHPEYPRPQMVRTRWQNLNGLWDFEIGTNVMPTRYDGTILVPFPIESALSGVRKRLDERGTLWYHRKFEVPQSWKTSRIKLHFGAVDWKATVYINGKLVASHRGGYDRFTVDITKALREGAQQDLLVAVVDPTETEDQPRGKQSLKPSGIFYTPTSGIWQTVWMEPVPEAGIEDLTLIPDIDARQLGIRVGLSPGTTGLKVEAMAYREGHLVGQAEGPAGTPLKLPLTEMRLWSPTQPDLYDLTVRLKNGQTVEDTVDSYFGMRKVAVRKDSKGISRIMLNDEFVFLAGVLDQGFWPDGIYTAPCDEALRADIEVIKKMGFNMLRKHVKVEPDRWYYWCDRLGMLVWQDMPSGNNNTDESKRQFETELFRMVDGLKNHPSVMMWVLFNEGWGQYDTERLTRWVQEMDPTRLVDSASGWTDKRVGDVIDMHSYPGPGTPRLEVNRAAVLGEFGGLGFGVTNHTWSGFVWGYQGMPNLDYLTRQFVRLFEQAFHLKKNQGLAAFVYTQATDIETECNGLITYDREIVKLPETRVASIIRDERAMGDSRVVVPCAEQEPVLWRYTFSPPGDGWIKNGFDDSGWREDAAGFGTVDTPSTMVRTEWMTADIWLRRQFNLENIAPATLRLHIYHDEDVEVYLNGVLAFSEPGYVPSYIDVDIRPEALATLKPVENTLAIHCHQTIGGQYIDAGFSQP
jgi:hypothetical protein